MNNNSGNVQTETEIERITEGQQAELAAAFVKAFWSDRVK